MRQCLSPTESDPPMVTRPPNSYRVLANPRYKKLTAIECASPLSANPFQSQPIQNLRQFQRPCPPARPRMRPTEYPGPLLCQVQKFPYSLWELAHSLWARVNRDYRTPMTRGLAEFLLTRPSPDPEWTGTPTWAPNIGVPQYPCKGFFGPFSRKVHPTLDQLFG